MEVPSSEETLWKIKKKRNGISARMEMKKAKQNIKN